jgi:hypothetical protein
MPLRIWQSPSVATDRRFPQAGQKRGLPPTPKKHRYIIKPHWLGLLVYTFVWQASYFHTSFLANRAITGNSAYVEGGEMHNGTLSGCALSNNVSAYYGGCSAGASLESYFVSNSAQSRGGASNDLTYGTSAQYRTPPISGGTVEVGEFECKTTFSSFATSLAAHSLQSDDSADYIDSDRIGMTTWQEWPCGNGPRDSRSILRMLPPFAPWQRTGDPAPERNRYTQYPGQPSLSASSTAGSVVFYTTNRIVP